MKGKEREETREKGKKEEKNIGKTKEPCLKRRTENVILMLKKLSAKDKRGKRKKN